MSDPLLPYYSLELTYIRAMAREFAKSHPAMAERLGVSENADDAKDPHVERMIEGFAYLTARIRRKLDDDFPELINGLMSVLYPHYQAPIPSMAIAQITLNDDQAELTDGYAVARESEIEVPVTSGPFAGESCVYRTCYPVTAWPIDVTVARLGALPFSSGGTRPDQAISSLQLTLRCRSQSVTFAQLSVRTFRFFLHGQDQHTLLLYELIFNNAVQLVLKRSSNDKQPILLGRGALREVGFDKNEGLLPYTARSFLGYRILTEYFAFPRKFLFFDVELGPEVLANMGGQIELLIYLNRTQVDLERAVTAEMFRLGCTPIVNLFSKSAEQIDLDETRTEYRVVADRRHQSAHEIYSVDSVTVASRGTRPVECRPFYTFSHRVQEGGRDVFWYARRRAPRRNSQNDPGTEVYLSLVDLDYTPVSGTDRMISAQLTCLSRDLPQHLSSGGDHIEMKLGAGGPISIDCLTQPTPTLRGAGGRGNMWRLFSHLCLNHLSLEGSEAAEALREILRLYNFADSAETGAKIDGIIKVAGKRVVGRAGGVAGGLCRGVEITIEFDEDRYSDRGLYLFAGILDRFLALYCSVNSFVELVAATKQKGTPLRRFPRRAGDKVLL